MNWNEEEINLSREIYELLGEERVPKVGEWWMIKLCVRPVLVCEVFEDRFASNIYDEDEVMTEKFSRFLHPLYTEGELLEIIGNTLEMVEIIWDHPMDRKVYICDCNEMPSIAIYGSDTVLTALLRLTVEVLRKEGG